MATARTSYSDCRALPDPLLSYNFDLIIPVVPGGGDGKGLTVRCKSTSLPGTSVDDVTVSIHGVDLKYAGKQLWTHTLQVQYQETRDMLVSTALKRWIEFARNTRQNTGSYKVNYETTADLVLYDDAVKVIRTIRLEGFFPQTMDDAALDGSSSTPVEISATFFYDSHYNVT